MACLAVAGVIPRRVGAAACALPGGAAPLLRDRDPRERLAWIDAHLGRTAAHARIWTWGWAGGVGGAGIVSLAAVPFVAPGDRVDWYTGAVSSAIGVVPFLVAPLAVIKDAPRLHAAILTLPAEDERALCSLLAEAEARLDADAGDEALQQRWWIHAGNLAFNTGILLFLGLGFHHWSSGIINGVAGTAVGEAMIFTQPTATVDDALTYRRGDWRPEAAAGFGLHY